MNEQIFWDIIANSRQVMHTNFESQCAHISTLLLAYKEEEIIGFEQILCEQLEKANTWPMMAASFVVCSFISEETYEDFRAWTIGQGKDNFEKIVRDPNEICKLISPKQVKEMGGEHLLFAALNAYMEKINAEEEEDEIAFFEKINKPDEKEIEQAWPESKNAYRKLFPQLFDTFWNEDRIKELLEAAEDAAEE